MTRAARPSSAAFGHAILVQPSPGRTPAPSARRCGRRPRAAAEQPERGASKSPGADRFGVVGGGGTAALQHAGPIPRPLRDRPVPARVFDNGGATRSAPVARAPQGLLVVV